jgi:hypothetical protein
MSQKFVNCMKHECTIQLPSGGIVTIPPSGVEAQVTETETVASTVEIEGEKVEISEFQYGAVQGLPEPSQRTIFIVNGMVLSALGGSRPDCLAPNSGQSAVRENGKIQAITRLRSK